MFTADSRTENFLTQLGVKFAYRNGLRLPSDFSPNWETENIGRPVAVREDAVLEYSALMESGSAAPAPIMLESKEGLRILDGVQRVSAAALIESTRVSGYVVETDSEDLIATIRVLANARLQGRPEPPEWTRRRAVEVLVLQRGMSHAEVASMGGWAKADVERLAVSIELQSRIANAGGPNLPDTILGQLSAHLPPDGLLSKAQRPVTGFLQTLKQSRLAASDARPFIAAFFAPLYKNANPHKVFSERLDDVHADPEIQARLSGRKCAELPKDVLLLRSLKASSTLLDQILSHGVALRNVDEYFRLLESLKKRIQSIAPNKKTELVRVPADMWGGK